MAKHKSSASTFKGKTAQVAPRQPKLPPWVWLAGGGVVAVLLVIGLLYLGFQGPAITNSTIEGAEVLPDPGQGHQEGDIAHTDEVPVGGIHNAAWQNCGIYEEPTREENVIHSMEHGAVWLAYQPDMPADQVENLRNLVRQERSRQGEPLIVLAPKPDLDASIIATAWGVQLKLDRASDERLVQFLQRYLRGSFTPEPGAACGGGVGEPLS